MSWNVLRNGWKQTRLPAATRAAYLRTLQKIQSGELPSKQLDAVHGAVRSSVRLHARVHWVEMRLHWRDRSVRPMVQQVAPMVFAPVSSLGRRLGGVANDAPQDPSLLTTWQRVFQITCGSERADDG